MKANYTSDQSKTTGKSVTVKSFINIKKSASLGSYSDNIVTKQELTRQIISIDI